MNEAKWGAREHSVANSPPKQKITKPFYRNIYVEIHVMAIIFVCALLLFAFHQYPSPPSFQF